MVAAAPPPPGDTRVVHIGRLSAGHGVAELIEVAGRPVPHGVRMDLIGPADRDVRPVTTPPAAPLVERAGCGVVVPLDVGAVVRAVLDLKEDPVRRAELGARGHAEARLHHRWPDHAPDFVALMETWAGLGAPVQPLTV